MRIRFNYNEKDLDQCYDVLIFTVLAMAVIVLIGRLAGVC